MDGKKKRKNTHISQDGGKYWEFPGNTGDSKEILGFIGEFLNMTLLYPRLQVVWPHLKILWHGEDNSAGDSERSKKDRKTEQMGR